MPRRESTGRSRLVAIVFTNPARQNKGVRERAQKTRQRGYRQSQGKHCTSLGTPDLVAARGELGLGATLTNSGGLEELERAFLVLRDPNLLALTGRKHQS